MRQNTGNIYGILAEFVVEFLSAVDRARSDAMQSGAEPLLIHILKPHGQRHAPEIPVRYEAPPPWRVIQQAQVAS